MFMMMNNKKEKEHTAQQKEGNQETKLREDINSASKDTRNFHLVQLNSLKVSPKISY